MCAKSNSNRKLLTISLVFLSCGSNAAHGWHILYQRWRNPPQDSGVDQFFSFFFSIWDVLAYSFCFRSIRLTLTAKFGTLGFKLLSTVAESMSIVQLRGRKPPSLILMSVISPAEGVRERLNHQSSRVCPAEWTIPLSLHLPVADPRLATIKHVARPFSLSFLTKKAVFIIST